MRIHKKNGLKIDLVLSRKMNWMLKKQPGENNELIYDQTAYRGGRYRLYPTIDGLVKMLDELIQASATTEYLHINSFYKNN